MKNKVRVNISFEIDDDWCIGLGRSEEDREKLYVKEFSDTDILCSYIPRCGVDVDVHLVRTLKDDDCPDCLGCGMTMIQHPTSCYTCAGTGKKDFKNHEPHFDPHTEWVVTSSDSEDDNKKDCEICDGSGHCPECGTGECDTCAGTGKRDE